MALAYDEHRKKRQYHDDHPLTRRQRRKRARQRRRQRDNLRDSAFGKINWSAYDHRQLWDMIKSAEPAAMGERAHRWATLAANVDAATAGVRATCQELLLSWRGGSAVRAAESTTKLTTWASDASQTARKIGDGLDDYTSAVAEAQRKIPEPVHPYLERWFREGYDVSALEGRNGAYMMDQLLDDHLPSKQQATRAKAEAVQVMDTYESASKGVQTKLPGFTDAPVVTADGSSSAVRPFAAAATEPPGADETTTSAAAGPVVAGAGQLPGGAGPGHGGVSGVPGTPGYGAPGAGHPGGPGVATPGIATPGGGSGSGLPGSPAAAGGAAAAAGARGGAGTPFGMYPPMAGARGENSEDTEHKNRYELGLDLMDDLPPAYPPVFGQ
ncbi:WXG100 family type VII secretion target [Amycolatopsis nigrescens]|uniref:WXG100 family type VII secretion target n=1 Tax=Amycolatopsis nigrescens TaxID=381445 RepID=UPI00036765D7|nr:PPE domain-containing protein [Amycolatopsis nigrescens]